MKRRKTTAGLAAALLAAGLVLTGCGSTAVEDAAPAPEAVAPADPAPVEEPVEDAVDDVAPEEFQYDDVVEYLHGRGYDWMAADQESSEWIGSILMAADSGDPELVSAARELVGEGYARDGRGSRAEGRALFDAVVDGLVANGHMERPAKPAAPRTTVAQDNAREKAQSYLSHTAFSRSGLIDQLKYEGFSEKDATWAVDDLAPNWKRQAVKKAESYLSHTAFSRSGLIDQLLYEGFTREQAGHAANRVGF